MYRSTKKKVVRRASVSSAIAAGLLVTGVGIASASPPAPTHSTSPKTTVVIARQAPTINAVIGTNDSVH